MARPVGQAAEEAVADSLEDRHEEGDLRQLAEHAFRPARPGESVLHYMGPIHLNIEDTPLSEPADAFRWFVALLQMGIMVMHGRDAEDRPLSLDELSGETLQLACDRMAARFDMVAILTVTKPVTDMPFDELWSHSTGDIYESTYTNVRLGYKLEFRRPEPPPAGAGACVP